MSKKIMVGLLIFNILVVISSILVWDKGINDRFEEVNVSTDDIITADNKEGKILKVEVQFSEDPDL